MRKESHFSLILAFVRFILVFDINKDDHLRDVEQKECDFFSYK